MAIFFGERNIEELELKLIGAKHNVKDLKYIQGLSTNNFIKDLMDITPNMEG